MQAVSNFMSISNTIKMNMSKIKGKFHLVFPPNKLFYKTISKTAFPYKKRKKPIAIIDLNFFYNDLKQTKNLKCVRLFIKKKTNKKCVR